MNVPKLRFPEFREMGEWEVKELGGFSKVVASGDLDSKLFSPTASDNHIFPVYSNALEYQGLYGYYAIAKYPKNSITITARGNLGFSFFRNKPFMGIGRLIVVTELKEVDAQFLNECWNHLAVTPQEVTSIPQLTAVAAKKMELPIPTFAEQQKIADCLSSLDELVTAETQTLEAYKQHKKGLMQQLFPQTGETTPRLRFPEFREMGEWVEKTLSEVATNLDNLRVPITSNRRVKGSIPYYGASGVVDYVSDYIFDEDLLCVSEDGANLVDRTYPIAFSISGKSWVNNHAHVLKFKHMATQIIIENYLNSIQLDDYLTGMAQPKLNKAMLEKIRVSLPKLPEQQKIANCLSSLDELITAQSQKIEGLKLHKKGLMQGLFPNPTEEAAS